MIEKNLVVPFLVLSRSALFFKTRIPRDALEPLLTLQPLLNGRTLQRNDLLFNRLLLSVLRPGKAKAMESPGKFVASLHHFRARF